MCVTNTIWYDLILTVAHARTHVQTGARTHTHHHTPHSLHGRRPVCLCYCEFSSEDELATNHLNESHTLRASNISPAASAEQNQLWKQQHYNLILTKDPILHNHLIFLGTKLKKHCVFLCFEHSVGALQPWRAIQSPRYHIMLLDCKLFTYGMITYPQAPLLRWGPECFFWVSWLCHFWINTPHKCMLQMFLDTFLHQHLNHVHIKVKKKHTKLLLHNALCMLLSNKPT